MTETMTRATELADQMARLGIEGFDVALVLGSGLGGFADRLEDPRVTTFDEVASMPSARVPGHSGRWTLGRLGEARVLVQEGRVHLYEGWSAEEVVRAVRAYGELGAKALVLTNAAGSLVPELALPTLMRIEDHVNMQGASPLARSEVGRGSPYDQALGALVEGVARDSGIELRRGVYAGLLGPSYETPAEVRMLAKLGLHAVGMSTVCEATAGHAAGMRVVGLSLLSNFAAGIASSALSHAEVVAAADQIAPVFEGLLERAVPAISDAVRSS